MRILFVGADPMELAGVLRRCGQARALKTPIDWARAARLGEHEVVLAANGAGAARAAAAVDAGMAGFAADAIVSIGFCGALDTELEVADVVVANAIVTMPGDELQSRDRQGAGSGIFTRSLRSLTVAALKFRYRTGAVCSLDHVARTAAEKHRLRSTGAIAVEMEAAGVAARAEALGRPFYCIKAVTDLASEDLSIDFNELLRSDGHFDKIGILRSSLRHPSVRLPELFRLRKRSIRAREILGDFIADCRF